MFIFASALYIKLGKQLILLYFKTMQNSDYMVFNLRTNSEAIERPAQARQILLLI